MSDLPPDDLDLPEDEEEEGALHEEGAFPASENTPGQSASRDSFARMQEKIDELITRKEQPPWWQEYLELRAEGWDWRKAVFIAWSASPTKIVRDGITVERWPATQEQLARDVLGLKSDRVIATWKKKYPEMQLRIEQQAAAPYLKHMRDIIDANIVVAMMPDPSAFQDRRMALEVLKVYRPKQTQEINGVIHTFDLAKWKEQREKRMADAEQTLAEDEHGTVENG